MPNPETVTVTLSGYAYPLPVDDIGTLSDPTPDAIFTFDPDTHTFSEDHAINTVSPTPATTILHRLTYTPPPVTEGNEANAYAKIDVNGVTDKNTVQIETAGPPKITLTNAHQPVPSGKPILPFGAVQIANAYIPNDTLTASITLTDSGAATDADGLLFGEGFLSKTGVGKYTVSGLNSYNLQGFLNKLVFTPTAVAPGATRPLPSSCRLPML